MGCDFNKDFPGGNRDLVSAQYLHSRVEFNRQETLRKAATVVAPGGHLISEHAASPP